MKLSVYAVSRIVEEEAAKDPNVARQLAVGGRLRLDNVRALSDEQLLEKLREVGTPVDRAEFERLAAGKHSAVAVAEELIRRFQPDFSGEKTLNEDWPWMACVCLWGRWMSRPSCEMLDDEIHAGYDEQDNGDSVPACIRWSDVWKHWLRIADECRCQTLRELDELVSGTQSVSNWISDYETELYNAGRDEENFHRQHIELCQTVLQRFPNEDQLLIENFRRGMAEAHSLLGERDIADRLFEEWLAHDPQWGWGWIGWSDCYFYDFADSLPLDADKAETLLKRGLEVPGLRDRNDVLERLADLYFELERDDEGNAVCEQMTDDDEPLDSSPVRIRDSVSLHDRMLQHKRTFDFGEAGLPLDEFGRLSEALRSGVDPFADDDFEDEPFSENDDASRLAARRKVGRNEPCPCGSGKKFKRCCGRG